MWYLDREYSKHMTGQKDLLSNYTEKFYGNAKRCSVRTEDGKELLVGTRKSNLYTINLSIVQTDNQLVKGLPELKYEKEHLCATCEKGKMKRAAHKPKPEQSTSSPLELLHMDLCGPMRTQSISVKKYVLVIVDDYSRYTWVKFLRSKDETPEVIISFLKTTQVNLQKPVKLLRTDTDTKCFVLNDRENLNKFGPKADEDIFIGYSQSSTAYQVYLKKSKTVKESVNVTFDEEVASEQSSSEPVLTGVLASRQISLKPVSNETNSDNASTSTSHLSELDLLFEFF
ncbi:hypothetical protein L6452_32629 [Arctium lappa]|uniref:Uncharacterized protein n=1 Tax=Arctium lappa TaxID=4217 RepID=A0ACB8Z5S3_ARCLA|nr:hypothetical protein L6452_32629 [Arctium lappa]